MPFVAAAIRAWADDLTPLADHAYTTLRAYDVGTTHQPLIGTWTSAAFGLPPDLTYNHPGPLQFLALAPWVRGLGPATGLPVGAVVLNAAAVATVGWVGQRRGGAPMALLALTVALLLTSSMGDALLADAWAPVQVMLPTLAALFLAWGVAEGDAWLLPGFVAWSGLVVQTHLSTAYLLGGVGTLAVLMLFLGVRRGRRSAVGPPPLIATAVTAVAVWCLPAVEELRPGRGNLSRIWMALGETADAQHVGLVRAVRLVAAVVVLPPAWLRPSLAETFRQAGGDGAGLGLAFGGVPAIVPSAAALGLALAATGLATRWARRRAEEPNGRRPGSAAIFAGVVLLVALFAVARLPVGPPLGLAPHMVRFLWPVGAFVVFGLLADSLLGRSRPWARPVLVVALIGVTVLATVPGHRGRVVPRLTDARAEPLADEALETVTAVLGRGAYLVRSPAGFTDPFGSALLLALRRDGSSIYVTDPVVLRQVGAERAVSGRRLDGVVGYRWGIAYGPAPPAARVLFDHPGRPADRRMQVRAEARLARALHQGALRIDPRVVPALRRLSAGRDLLDVRTDPQAAERAAGAGMLSLCVAQQRCRLDATARSDLRRLERLRARAAWDRLIVWREPPPPRRR